MAYYIYHGASGTGTGADWTNACVSIAALIVVDAAAFTTSGNIIYFADDHNDPNKAANWTLTGPGSGLPVILISADRTQATPTYKKGTGNQLSGLGGDYNIVLDGSFALYGIKASVVAAAIFCNNDWDELFFAKNCTFNITGAQGNFYPVNIANAISYLVDCVIDLNSLGSTVSPIQCNGTSTTVYLIGCTVANGSGRTGTCMLTSNTSLIVSGGNFSTLTNATTCEVISANALLCTISNSLTAATWVPVSGTPGNTLMLTNVGPADDPTYLYCADKAGTVVSATSIYRTGGATVEGDACSWLITTTATCAEVAPFYTPWLYGTVSSAGSKTFTLYITNDTADFTDAEVWLEVESLSTSDEAIWALATDQRATITTTAVAQTDDTTSTWVEISGSGTYSQTGTTMTVTDTAHGLIVGNAIVLDCTSGDGNDGTYTIVSVPTADTFTVTSTTSETVSGNCDWQMAPLYFYKQSLAVTATVNETGQFRARVAVGVASIASSRYFYVDPKVTVS